MLLCFVLVLIGVSYQALATVRDARTFPPLGQRVDVGGYKLHIHTLFSLLSVAWDQSFWIGIPTMLTPTVAMLLTLLVITRDGYTGAGWRSLGVHRFGWRAWRLAFLAPLLRTFIFLKWP